jgi:hypothetical protein
MAEAREVIEHDCYEGIRCTKLLGFLQCRAECLFGFGIVPLLIESRATMILFLPGLLVIHEFPNHLSARIYAYGFSRLAY